MRFPSYLAGTQKYFNGVSSNCASRFQGALELVGLIPAYMPDQYEKLFKGVQTNFTAWLHASWISFCFEVLRPVIYLCFSQTLSSVPGMQFACVIRSVNLACVHKECLKTINCDRDLWRFKFRSRKGDNDLLVKCPGSLYLKGRKAAEKGEMYWWRKRHFTDKVTPTSTLLRAHARETMLLHYLENYSPLPPVGLEVLACQLVLGFPRDKPDEGIQREKISVRHNGWWWLIPPPTPWCFYSRSLTN